MNEIAYETEGSGSSSGWWLLFLVGLLSIVVGVIILFKPGDSLNTLAVITGIFLLVNGILELIASFMRSTPDRGLVALFGVLSAIVGVLLIRHPIAGVEFVAILIGLWLITVGIIRFATAFYEYSHRFWHGLAGLLAMLAGIVVIVDTNIGYATLALLIGIGFIANGIGMTALGWDLKEVEE